MLAVIGKKIGMQIVAVFDRSGISRAKPGKPDILLRMGFDSMADVSSDPAA